MVNTRISGSWAGVAALTGFKTEGVEMSQICPFNEFFFISMLEQHFEMEQKSRGDRVVNVFRRQHFCPAGLLLYKHSEKKSFSVFVREQQTGLRGVVNVPVS